MAIIGTLLKNGIKIRESIEQEYSRPFELQKNELKKLMITAAKTKFAKRYFFDQILNSYKSSDTKSFYNSFKEHVPIFNYNMIYTEWWHRSRAGEKDVTWPGKIKYFALSSGTSESSSKYIPITKEIRKAIQKTSVRQILSLSHYDLPPKFFQTGILMLGGSTHLNKTGHYFDGDLSGIQAANLPFWFQHFYKPGKKIAQTREWDTKLNEIAGKAKDWDIGIVVGVPAWIQILMEKIIAFYKCSNIHDIWPNLKVYVHGGVAFEPYRKGFEKLLGKPIHYIETYLASEGFIAFQAFPGRKSMRLVLNNGLFYEFVPFIDLNFDENGELNDNVDSLMIDEVEEGKEYAILLSSCAGAWRYLIGDVIKFVSIEESEIVITGRTKHFLSLCGEHLSVDNMNKAIELVSSKYNLDIKEFCVMGVPHGSLFAHHWYIGCDDPVNPDDIKESIDRYLMELNDDYSVERSAALKDIITEILPTSYFYEFMNLKGKIGGQNKFPRVLKKNFQEDWISFINSKSV